MSKGFIRYEFTQTEKYLLLRGLYLLLSNLMEEKYFIESSFSDDFLDDEDEEEIFSDEDDIENEIGDSIFDSDEFDDDDEDDWFDEDEDELDSMIQDVKRLEGKILVIGYTDSPELTIDELELLLHSSHEVKGAMMEDESDDSEEYEDDEYLVAQKRELGNLIEKINDWIDNYNIINN